MFPGNAIDTTLGGTCFTTFQYFIIPDFNNQYNSIYKIY